MSDELLRSLERRGEFVQLDIERVRRGLQQDPEQVISGKEPISVYNRDRAYASLTAVVEAVLRDALDDERRVRALEIVAIVSEYHADVAVMAARPLCAQAIPWLFRKYGTRVDATLKTISANAPFPFTSPTRVRHRLFARNYYR